MFLGIAFLGVALGVALLIALNEWGGRREEKKDAEYLRDRLKEARENVRRENTAHRVWRARTEETDRQLNEAYGEQESLRTQLEEADEALDLACEDLANAEEEIEELEEESDGFEESATEAFEQLTIANDLVKHTFAWAERVLDVAEKAGDADLLRANLRVIENILADVDSTAFARWEGLKR